MTRLLITLTVLFSSLTLIAQETLMLRSYHEKRGKDNRIEIYGPDGEYRKIQTGNWKIENDKEFQMRISREIDKINQRGFELVSYNEVFIDYVPYVLFTTYVFKKD